MLEIRNNIFQPSHIAKISTKELQIICAYYFIFKKRIIYLLLVPTFQVTDNRIVQIFHLNLTARRRCKYFDFISWNFTNVNENGNEWSTDQISGVGLSCPVNRLEKIHVNATMARNWINKKVFSFAFSKSTEKNLC